MKESVWIFPGFDKKKMDFLMRKKLLSNRDGVIAKKLEAFLQQLQGEFLN